MHGELFVAEEAERLHQTGDRAQQTEQGGESDQRIHHDEEAASPFDLDAGGDLQRSLKRRVLVIQAVPHHAENRIARVARQARSFGHIADLDRGKDFLDPLGVAAHPAAQPPEDTLKHDRQGGERDDKDRPHDRAAFVEIIHEKVSSLRPAFVGGG